jgi:hypothetical protein
LNPRIHRLHVNFKALRELGPRQAGLYALYRFGLITGYFRRQEASYVMAQRELAPVKIAQPLAFTDPEEIAAKINSLEDALVPEAEEILAGQVRLFGGPPVPLRLAAPGPLRHWTEYEIDTQAGEADDIKFIWEPARFGWAFTLGRAYHLTGDERYAEFFWRSFEVFNEANPPYLGQNWISAQEVGLRLAALAFASQVFASARGSTPERLAGLSAALAAHANRIPPTLAYARAQNNNHLLTEAAGLVTASLFLPSHPGAQDWSRLGWRWFNAALGSQIAGDGTYIQHSCNYHRLMLQAALWVYTLRRPFPDETRKRLALATRWLLEMVDPKTGRVPNLGPNDGAYILPLASLPFEDYRPVLQAASLAFLGRLAFEEGPWDEMALWLGDGRRAGKPRVEEPEPRDPLAAPHVLRQEGSGSWAYLRVARFTGRPGHADQLHLDLWWQGINLAQDPGSYLYNALPPWDNPLGTTAVHNTLTIGGQDQMTLAGRFLWLDWAQARVIAHGSAPDGSLKRLTAQHDGYRRLGLIHQREVAAQTAGHWTVTDSLLEPGRSTKAKTGPRTVQVRLHWLLPDLPWEIEQTPGGRVELCLESPGGLIRLITSAGQGSSPAGHTLARAGERLSGEGRVLPTWGWASPTYGVKKPALSFSFEVLAIPPAALLSEWILP